MKIAPQLALILAVTISPAAQSQELRKISSCFEETLAALRLSQLEDGIARCGEVIENKATAPELRGQAYAQRGLMQARRWSVMATTAFATQGIADITEALKLHTPSPNRKHQLWLVRAQLYAATGQTKRARDDYGAVLAEDPSDPEAVTGLARTGSPGL